MSIRLPWRRTAALAVAAMLLPAAQAATFSENFNGGAVSPMLQFSASDPGFSFADAGGWGMFSKADGTGNGFGYLRTRFQVVGNFTASVQLLRDGLLGQGEAGLDLRFFGSYPDGFADVWSQGLNTLVANIYLPTPPGYGSSTLNNVDDALMTLSVVRIGQTLGLYAGGQKLREATGPELTGPVTVELFLGQESGNTVGHHALFDNLFIRGEFVSAPVPEPASYALFGVGLAGMALLKTRRTRRALQAGVAA